ncbi:hypothetical protein ACI6Q2_22455 [Chitinophagaceae bacterium LWZ2-11]
MKNALLMIFCICSFLCSAQKGSRPSVLNTLIQNVDDTLNLKYTLSVKDAIKIHKSIIRTYRCDNWFTDFVLIIEQYDSLKNEFVRLGCNMDVDPAINLDGTLGPEIVIKDSLISYTTFVGVKRSIENKHRNESLDKGKYRIQAKCYYYTLNGKRMFINSDYVYFKIE